ncbi:MAG TPA: hypothetical protein VGM76_04590 [Lacipirellulaceae bacterium]
MFDQEPDPRFQIQQAADKHGRLIRADHFPAAQQQPTELIALNKRILRAFSQFATLYANLLGRQHGSFPPE